MFYLTAFINMLVLPLILLCYTSTDMYKTRYHAMPVNLYNPHSRSQTHLPKRECLDILLTGDTASDNIKIRFGQVYIRQIINTKDTVHGILFHFGKNSKYAEFVAVLDVCNIEDVGYYIVTDSTIKMWFYRPRPSKYRKETDTQPIQPIYL